MTRSIPQITFLDGNAIDQLGFGVWQVPDEQVESVVAAALHAGYRHIDTAAIYGNETGVGRAVAASSLPRSEVYLTTKVWNADQGYESTLAAFETSLQKLDTDYVDLYLIHWLQPKRKKYVDTWKALVELKNSGRARSIGVANFTVEALEELYEATGVRPVINQVETHPYFPQQELREYEREHGIVHESWSPLGQGGELLEDPILGEVAAKHQATVAQVVIAWHLALGNVVIPKSVTESRIVENFAALDVKLDDEDLAKIAGLDRGDQGRIASDPATSDFQ